MDALLSVRDLDAGYPGRCVVSGLNLEALRGQVICLLGPNGAGKSTVLRTLAGLLAPRGGAVVLAGQSLGSMPPKQLARLRSLVLTGADVPDLTTVAQLLALGRTPYTNLLGRLSARDRAAIEDALEAVGAGDLRDRIVRQLSDGEKQKVLIARALVQEPSLMILDEPTSHLDIRHKVEVIRVLQSLAQTRGITCILSLHDIDLALKGCQTVLLVENGAITAQGIPEDVAASGAVEQLYRLRNAHYLEQTGSVELSGPDRNDLFLVGGCGTGAPFYRALSRTGYGLTSGVLHTNDIDCSVAQAICSAVVSTPAFEPISAPALVQARERMEQAAAVVDTGFPIGSGNRDNLQLLRLALDHGTPVFSSRDPEELARLLPPSAVLHPVRSMEALLNKLPPVLRKEVP